MLILSSAYLLLTIRRELLAFQIRWVEASVHINYALATFARIYSIVSPTLPQRWQQCWG